MVLEMVKFGNILNSRPAGHEAVLRAKQIVNGSNDTNGIILDFSAVEVLTPSFAEEFINGLKAIYQNTKITYKGITDNTVTKDSLTALGFLQ
jgi:hypothetical protein